MIKKHRNWPNVDSIINPRRSIRSISSTATPEKNR